MPNLKSFSAQFVSLQSVLIKKYIFNELYILCCTLFFITVTLLSHKSLHYLSYTKIKGVSVPLFKSYRCVDVFDYVVYHEQFILHECVVFLSYQLVGQLSR